MISELKKIMLSDGEILPSSYEMSFSSITVNGFYPFASPVAVTGIIQGHTGSAKLNARVSFDFEIPCGRYTTEFHAHYDPSFPHIVVSSLTDGDSDLYIVAGEYRLGLDTLLREDILLELPTRFLRSPNCRDLCPQRKQNPNQGTYQCVSRQTDPRLVVLRQLID